KRRPGLISCCTISRSNLTQHSALDHDRSCNRGRSRVRRCPATRTPSADRVGLRSGLQGPAGLRTFDSLSLEMRASPHGLFPFSAPPHEQAQAEDSNGPSEACKEDYIAIPRCGSRRGRSVYLQSDSVLRCPPGHYALGRRTVCHVLSREGQLVGLRYKILEGYRPAQFCCLSRKRR